jgi:type I restriction enzyme S subunit
MAWEEIELGKVIDIFDSRRIPLSSMERQQRQGQYPYYGASGIIDYIDGYIFDGDYILIAEDGENLNSRKLPVAFWGRGQFWVNNHAHIVKGKPNLADDAFLMYWFAQADISGYVTGTAQPKLSQANLKLIKLALPPIEIQHRIADILSVYDELIENNCQRVKLLEQAALDLYEEWFAHFRFPNHENVPFVESGLGLIPQGWKVSKLGNLVEINARTIGKNPPQAIEYVDIASVSTGRIDTTQIIPFGDAPSRARRIVQNGDVIWATVRPNRRSYALIVDPSENLIVSTGFAVLSPVKVPYTYLYHAVTTNDFAEYLTNHATGSAYPAVNAGDFAQAKILLPDTELLKEFHNLVADLYQAKVLLERKNHLLREARDLLLPRLVSGELEVSTNLENVG